MKKLLIAILIAGAFSSCSNYYRVIAAPEPTKPTSYNNFQNSMKYYVLRNGSEAFAMKNISISTDRKNLECTLESLPQEHQVYIKNGSTGKLKYKKAGYEQADEAAVLNEVHIYITPGLTTGPGTFSLALANIQKIELIEKDKTKTRNSHAMGVGIGIGATLLILLGIGAAMYSSTSFL